jgi:VWFA-related protein
MLFAMRLCHLALCAAVVAAGPRGLQSQQVFRAGVDTVSIYATVRSSDGHLVTDLTKDDIEIKDNGVTREVTNFSREIVPITVVMLLDMSGSQEAGVEWMRTGAGAFVNRMLAADRARIGTFGVEIALSPRLTSDPVYLHRVLREEIWPGGGTPLWEAMDLGMSSLAGEQGRRVILALTDGIDTTPPPAGLTAPLNINDPSGTTTAATKALQNAQGAFSASGKYAVVRTRAEREGFMVYAVGHVAPDGAPGAGGFPLSGQIRALATDSGGGYRSFAERDNAAAALSEVADELHHQYLIGFSSTALDGKVHRLEIKAKRGGMTVQARKSYLAVAAR